jgi:hypothetical protein
MRRKRDADGRARAAISVRGGLRRCACAPSISTDRKTAKQQAILRECPMFRLGLALRTSVFAAAIAIVSTTSAMAQLAPARTWSELKEAVQQRGP